MGADLLSVYSVPQSSKSLAQPRQFGVRKAEVEDGSPDTVTPTVSGFTNRKFICDGGVYFNRSIDSILRLGPGPASDWLFWVIIR